MWSVQFFSFNFIIFTKAFYQKYIKNSNIVIITI